MWPLLIASAIGAGTSLYGANKQSKDQARANAENTAAIKEADQSAWQNYLMQRGIYAGNAPTGTIPGMQPGAAVNTKLPLWATVKMQPQATPGATGGGLRVVRRGTGTQQPALPMRMSRTLGA